MEKKYCVYIHTNKINGKKYVGQACQQVEARWKHGDGYKNNIYFYRAIQKYGWDGFVHEIIANNLTLDEANQLEIDLIEKYNTLDSNYGYNLRAGGSKGALSQDTIEKIRQSNLGQKRTKEACKNMSEARKKVIITSERMEQYRQQGLAHRGFNHGMSKPVLCIDTGEIFGSSGEAERKMSGVNSKGIRNACNGYKGQKTHAGYHWRFLTKEEIKEVVKCLE